MLAAMRWARSAMASALVAGAAGLAPATEPGTPPAASSVGFRGVGIRAGFASDPDQFVGGVHFDLGSFARNVRFQPDVQLGFGDDATTLVGTAAVHYRFRTGQSLTPYAGGGVSLGWIDWDEHGDDDDSDFEVGVRATGGLEWPRSGGQAFLLEFNLCFGDLHDAVVVAGWTF
jgi:opacity protein-like surface antigen